MATKLTLRQAGTRKVTLRSAARAYLRAPLEVVCRCGDEDEPNPCRNCTSAGNAESDLRSALASDPAEELTPLEADALIYAAEGFMQDDDKDAFGGYDEPGKAGAAARRGVKKLAAYRVEE